VNSLIITPAAAVVIVLGTGTILGLLFRPEVIGKFLGGVAIIVGGLVAAASLIFAFWLFGFTSAANAATFTAGPGGKWIDMQGEIIVGDGDRFTAVYDRMCKKKCPDLLFVDSIGGDYVTGFDIAGVVIDKNMNVAVGPDAKCLSMCFTVWAAGARHFYFASSSIGVHQIYTNDTGLTEWTATYELIKYLREWGVPQQILHKVMITEPGDVASLTADDVDGWATWVEEDPSPAMGAGK
jgi:hypothetical protein